MPTQKFILQHGNFGEGPINPFIIASSKDALISKVKTIIPERHIVEINTYFDSQDCVHIILGKDFEYSGFSYNMFFIDAIEEI